MSGWISYDRAGNRQEWCAPTEDGVAQKLAEAQAERLRWCHDRRAWFVFDGALWRRDRTGAPTRLVRDLARDLAKEPGGRIVAAAGKPGFVAGVLRFARDDPALAVTGEAWDADPYLLGTPDGPIDLRTGAAAAADPGDGISRATAVAPAAPGTDAPAWCRFLDAVFGGDAALISFVQRFLGYALTGSTAERIVVLGCGPGGTGKTVLLTTVLHVLGDYARAAELAALIRPEASRPSGSLAALRGTRLVAVADASTGFDGRRLARLAGGDPLGGDVPTLKLLAMAETLPRLAGADPALRRRLRVVPFARRPARPDRRLADTLRAEAPAILRWMIDGCRAWQAEGLEPPAAVAAATAACLEASDTFARFLTERCDCGEARHASATAGDLWRAWRTFAEEAGERAGSQRLFAEALTARGFARDRTETARLYRGIALREGMTHDAADA